MPTLQTYFSKVSLDLGVENRALWEPDFILFVTGDKVRRPGSRPLCYHHGTHKVKTQLKWI